ncbi:MAG: type III pantothenate kinase [Bacteroidia bacterium]|nr:type III pantothenate kinase [Bacteroidia bacterium]
MNLVIDIGNTVAKIALFEGKEMVKLIYNSNQSLDGLEDLCRHYPVKNVLLASVIDLSNVIKEQLSQLQLPFLVLDWQTALPIANLYETPETLGYDRIAAVVGAHDCFPGRNCLVIDAGTCITYEFIDASGSYHGGNISPGIRMRFEALHQFTGRLPLIKEEGRMVAMGSDTETAIRAGVLKGVEYEMAGYIKAFQEKYTDLLVFLTGGDEISFDTNVKNIIFADRFLVLKGLNRILNYNNDKI